MNYVTHNANKEKVNSGVCAYKQKLQWSYESLCLIILASFHHTLVAI